MAIDWTVVTIRRNVKMQPTFLPISYFSSFFFFFLVLGWLVFWIKGAEVKHIPRICGSYKYCFAAAFGDLGPLQSAAKPCGNKRGFEPTSHTHQNHKTLRHKNRNPGNGSEPETSP